MARKIIWTLRSQKDRISIFSYWNTRTNTKSYSRKLNKLFIEAAELVSQYPHIGRTTNRKGIRIKSIGHFAIIYRPTAEELIILAIFDTRQNPDKVNKILDRE